MVRLLIPLACFSVIISGSWSWAKPAVSAHGMVVSTSPEATLAGVEILKKGGNAADAAVATALALAVTKPYYGSIGGGGFMMVKFKGMDPMALDHRERAPSLARPDMFLNNPKGSRTGGLASGVPGVVAGLVALHEKYGKLKWEKLVEPAVDLARKGFAVSYEWNQITEGEKDRFNAAAFSHLGAKDKKFPTVGQVLKQPSLARALELIQKKKLKGFYEGPLAEDIVSTAQKEGGVLSIDDLKNYKVRWLKPLVTKFNNHQIFLMPPPSSGGVVIFELLALMKKLEVPSTQALSADEFHLMAESMARAFSDRQMLGHPSYNKLPMDFILGEAHIQQWAKSISQKSKTPVDVKGNAPPEGTNTTHYVVVDQEGNAVSATTTVNDNYGSAVVTQKYGVTLNNEMDDFTTQPGQPNLYGLIQGDQNKVEAGKTPLSSMSPTIVLDNQGRVEIALGSPGGPRIISAVFQVLYRLLTTDWDMEQAIQAPRVHHQFMPDKIFYDGFGHSPDTLTKLVQKGHILEAGKIAKVYGIRKIKGGYWEGASDFRGEGLAAGH